MNEAYRSSGSTFLPSSFSSRLRISLDKYIQAGRDGVDLNSIYEKKREPNIVHLNNSMSDDIFDLACEIHNQGKPLDPHAWVNWMTNSYLRVFHDHVTVYQRSALFCNHAKQLFGDTLKEHFQRPVDFRIDPEIKNRVYV